MLAIDDQIEPFGKEARRWSRQKRSRPGPELTVSISEKAWVPALSFNEMVLEENSVKTVKKKRRVAMNAGFYVQGATSGEVNIPGEGGTLLGVELLDLRGKASQKVQLLNS